MNLDNLSCSIPYIASDNYLLAPLKLVPLSLKISKGICLREIIRYKAFITESAERLCANSM